MDGQSDILAQSEARRRGRVGNKHDLIAGPAASQPASQVRPGQASQRVSNQLPASEPGQASYHHYPAMPVTVKWGKERSVATSCLLANPNHHHPGLHSTCHPLIQNYPNYANPSQTTPISLNMHSNSSTPVQQCGMTLYPVSLSLTPSSIHSHPPPSIRLPPPSKLNHSPHWLRRPSRVSIITRPLPQCNGPKITSIHNIPDPL